MNNNIKHIVLDNGSSYYVYIPNSINENTDFFVYSFGAGMNQSNYGAALNKLNTVGSNKIVILADGDDSTFWTDKDDWANEALDVVYDIKKQYNISSNNVTSGCFSAGGYQGINTTIQHIRRNQNNNLEPQVAVLLDAYGFNRGERFYRPISNEDLQLLKKNNSILFAFQPPGKFPTEYQRYIDAGINMVKINCSRGDHMTINNDFFANNFLEAFHNNSYKFPTDSYEFTKFNKNTNSWETIDMNKINNYDKLVELFGIKKENNSNDINNFNVFSNLIKYFNLKNIKDILIKSDKISLESSLCNIKNAIKNSSNLYGGFFSTSCQSTTKVPSAISDIVSNYFKQNELLLESISNQINSFNSIEDSISKTEKDLEKDMDTLNK